RRDGKIAAAIDGIARKETRRIFCDKKVSRRLTRARPKFSVASETMSETSTAGPSVSLTEPAVGEVKSLMTKPENAGKFLRLYVEQGGCSGMQYGMVFDEKREGDLVSDGHGVDVLV